MAEFVANISKIMEFMYVLIINRVKGRRNGLDFRRRIGRQMGKQRRGKGYKVTGRGMWGKVGTAVHFLNIESMSTNSRVISS